MIKPDAAQKNEPAEQSPGRAAPDTNRRLRVSKETLRRLTSRALPEQDLRQVAGGPFSVGCTEACGD